MPGKIVDFLTKDCHIDFFIKEARKYYSKRNVNLEAKLGKKKRSGSTGDQARRDPDSGECDSNRNVDEI